MTTKRAGDVAEGDLVVLKGDTLRVEMVRRGREWQGPDDVRLYLAGHRCCNLLVDDRVEVVE